MAHLFPKTFPKDCDSPGERKVFEYFKKYAPDGWYILHSFKIPEHRRVVFGEADFVVIAPNFGVFILEVKSGGVGFDGTNWIYTNRKGEINTKQRGPFEQAIDAMFEVKRIITEKLGDDYKSERIHYSYGVIFTDEDSFPAEKMVENEPWRLLQRKDNNDYCAFIKYLAKQFDSELTKLGKQVPGKLSCKDAKDIAEVLRPIVECTTPLRSFLKQSEDDIINYTKEQLECLDDIFINKRMVVSGGAGTGKTLLAVEDAKQSAYEQLKVALFCFNKNLASYIRLNVDAEVIEVYSFHAFMVRFCKEVLGDEFINKDYANKDNYYDKILPEQMAFALDISEKKYDKIIVDEFQDLCTEKYLAVFDKLLKGGLYDGRFTFYGDFARQAIYLSKPDLQLLDSYTHYANKRLTKNCRNTKNIASELIKITSYQDKKYKLQIIGEPVDYIRYIDKKDEWDKLIEVVKQLIDKGIKGNSILILAPNVREKSVIGMYDSEKFIIGDYGDAADSYNAYFSTIHAYKGLESEIVILADIDDYSKINLMYIGISRARSKLIVLETNEAAKQRRKL